MKKLVTSCGLIGAFAAAIIGAAFGYCEVEALVLPSEYNALFAAVIFAPFGCIAGTIVGRLIRWMRPENSP